MTNPIQIRLLGTPTVQRADHPIKLGAGAQALLYYLAATQQPQTRATLAGLLWGETEEELARTSLRRTLSDIRKVVGDLFVSDYQAVALPSTACWIDLVEFQQAVTDTAPPTLSSLEAALELYQGDFLSGFFLRNAPEFEQWLLSQRAYYRDLALHGWQALATRYAQQGELTSAIRAARRMLILEPWHEEAHQALMRWLAQSGQRGAALAQFELCRRQLVDELAVEPSAETVTLYEAIRTGKLDKETRRQADAVALLSEGRLAIGDWAAEPARHPTAPTSAGILVNPKSSFPPQATPFVGRQQEVANVVQRLADPTCRLLTLVGPGGMGKTRLAIEAAKAIYDLRFTILDSDPSANENPKSKIQNLKCKDGVHFVALATVSTPSAIVAAIAEAVGFTFYNNGPAQQQLLGHLADKQLLFVLDNFEHLLAGVDLIVDLLNAAPGVKLLVTSREVLNLHQEWLYPISGLAVPTADAAPLIATGAEMGEVDAVRFFVQCAQRVRPTFTLNSEWRCVLHICRLVEGMPLAIELATAWLKTLSCTEIVEQLEHNLDFLTTRLHNIPQRHRSMRAVFEHSWQLLSEEEQAVLRRLAAMRGFCQDAAAAVAGASLFTLTVLAEKSLVQILRSEGHGRYTLHEMLRQFAEEKLQTDVAARATIYAQHSAYYLGRLAGEEIKRKGGQQRAALQAVGEELANIRVAWLWAAQQHRLEELAQHLDELYAFYTLSHRYQEGVELLEATLQAVAQAGTDDEDWMVRQISNRLGGLYTNLGRYAHAQSLLTTGLTRSQRLGLARESAFCLRVLGEIAGWQGNFAVGKTYLDQALALNQSLGDQEGVAYTLARLTDFALGLNDHQTIKTLCEQYLAVGQQLGNHRFVVHALRVLAFNSFTLGDYSATTAYCQEGLRLAEELGDHLELAIMLVVYMRNAAVIDTIQPDEAKALSAKSLALVQSSGQRYYIAMALYLISQTLASLHEAELAEQYGQQSLQIAQSANAVALVVGSLAVLGDLACQQQSFERSRHYLCEALQTGSAAKILLLTFEALVYYAALLTAESKVSAHEAAIPKRIQALEILVLARHHPACLHVFKARADSLLAELSTELPPTLFAAAQARGQQLTLEDAVAAVLSER